MPYRSRISVDDDYLRAVGRAAYNFAYLEWGMIWLGETLEPGFIGVAESLTAGQMGARLKAVIEGLERTHPLKRQLAALVTEFVSSLVVIRNDLVHGNPYTAETGEQRLLFSGKRGRRDWDHSELEEAARRFEMSSLEASNLLHQGGLYAAYAQNRRGA